MKTITLTLTEDEAKALVNWIEWTKENMDRAAIHYAEGCRIGRYICNDNPNSMHDANSLVLNVANILKKQLDSKS